MDIADKKIAFCVSGETALFADPVCSNSGESSTYLVPTYNALRGIATAIYWKPTVIWVIERVRIMNPIVTSSKSVRLSRSAFVPVGVENPQDGNVDLAMATYLCNVAYQVEAHMEWNPDRPDLACDRDAAKHIAIAERALRKGGRMPVFLGRNEANCNLASVQPCVFGEGIGAYDCIPTIPFGVMLHSVTYPGIETPTAKTNLFDCTMHKGVITFPRPEECTMVREFAYRELGKPITYVPGENFTPVSQESA